MILVEMAAIRARLAPRVILIHLAIVAVFGVWWPHQRGFQFFDPVFLTAYACLGVLFASPAAAQSFHTRPSSPRDAFVRIFWSVLYGELIALLILSAGIATVLSSHPPFGPDWIELAHAILLGFAATVALASLAGWFSLRFSPEISRMALRGLFLGLLLLFFFKSRWLPDVTGRAALICSGIAILAILAISRAINGSRGD